jgi:hypothetical protein
MKTTGKYAIEEPKSNRITVLSYSLGESGANRRTNQWQFNGDLDAAYRAGLGLYEATSYLFTSGAEPATFATTRPRLAWQSGSS